MKLTNTHKIAAAVALVAVLAIGTLGVSAQKLASPVASWTFDKTLAENTGKITAAPVYKNVKFVAGVQGQAAKFDGTGYFAVNTKPVLDSIQGAMTVTFDLKPQTAPMADKAQGVAGKFNSGQFFVKVDKAQEGGRTSFFVRDSNNVIPPRASSNGTLQVNQFHHMIGTYDGSMIRMYQDGVLVSEHEKTGTMKVSPDELLVVGATGIYKGDAVNGCTCAIDNLAVYDFAFGSVEIFLSGAGGNTLSIVGQTSDETSYTNVSSGQDISTVSSPSEAQ